MSRRDNRITNTELMHELKTEFHAYFEALFAKEINKHSEHFTSLRKVSRAILEIISRNEPELMVMLTDSTHVQKELLSPKLHGYLSIPENESQNGKAILDLLIRTLSSEKPDLSQILLIHGFFIYRLYDHCPNKMGTKDDYADRIYQSKIFSERRRQAVKNPVENAKPGIINNPALSKMSKILVFSRNAPKDQYKVDEASPFTQALLKQDLPIASSISGHTASLLLGAMIYGGLSKLELSEYLLATFSYLTLARAHTFHEVMVLGQTVGLPFSYEDYKTSIPEEIRAYPACRRISEMFPHLLPESEECNALKLHLSK